MRLAFALVLVALVLPGPVAAADSVSSGDPYGSSPSGQSAGDQYVETLPTTRGPRAPKHRKHARKVSRQVTRAIETQGGSDAGQLKALATSTALGAPADEPSGGNGTGGKSRGESASRSGKRDRSSSPAVPSAAIHAVDGGEAGLGWLVVALLAITALALGSVGYQRRKDRGPTR
jgi:hypothetical protein